MKMGESHNFRQPSTEIQNVGDTDAVQSASVG